MKERLYHKLMDVTTREEVVPLLKMLEDGAKEFASWALKRVDKRLLEMIEEGKLTRSKKDGYKCVRRGHDLLFRITSTRN